MYDNVLQSRTNVFIKQGRNENAGSKILPKVVVTFLKKVLAIRKNAAIIGLTEVTGSISGYAPVRYSCTKVS